MEIKSGNVDRYSYCFMCIFDTYRWNSLCHTIMRAKYIQNFGV